MARCALLLLFVVLGGCAGQVVKTDSDLRSEYRVETLGVGLDELRVRYAQTRSELEGGWAAVESAIAVLEQDDVGAAELEALARIGRNRARLVEYDEQLDTLHGDLRDAATRGHTWHDGPRYRYVLSLGSRLRRAQAYEARLRGELTPERSILLRSLVAQTPAPR